MRWLAFAGLLAACSDDYVIERGRLHSANPASVPSRAAVGVPFEVIVTTEGGCDTSPATTEVTYLDADTVVIEPFDRREIPRDCKILILANHQHRAEVTFETPGTKAVVVRGASSELTFPVAVE